jgi:hypothetical protein
MQHLVNGLFASAAIIVADPTQEVRFIPTFGSEPEHRTVRGCNRASEHSRRNISFCLKQSE